MNGKRLTFRLHPFSRPFFDWAQQFSLAGWVLFCAEVRLVASNYRCNLVLTWTSYKPSYRGAVAEASCTDCSVDASISRHHPTWSRLVRIEFSLRLSELIRFSSCLPLLGAHGVRWNLTDVGHQELHMRPHMLLGPRKTNICWSTLCLGLLRPSQHGPHATVPTRDDCDGHSQLVSELLPFPVPLGCIFIIGVTPIIKVGPLPQKNLWRPASGPQSAVPPLPSCLSCPSPCLCPCQHQR